MTQLYILAANYKRLNELLNSHLEFEEYTDDIAMFKETLDSIEDSIEVKVENIVKFIKNLDADIVAFKAEEDRLAKRRKYIENKKAGLKDYMESMLKLANIDEVTSGTVKVKFNRKPPSVDIIDPDLVPEQYREKVPDKISKTSLLKDLKEGVQIQGVRLIKDGQTLKIT